MKKILTSFINSPVLVTVVSLVVAGSVGAYVYQRHDSAPAYQFVEAAAGSISDIGTSSNGIQHVSLNFIGSGRVKSVSVKVGDAVKKGEVLAMLDPESALGAVTQAQAAYDSAKAGYEKVLNGATAATIDVSLTAVAAAEQNLQHLVDNAPTQVDNIIRTNVDSLYVNPNSYSPQFQVSFLDSSTNSNTTLTPSDTGMRLDLGNERLEMSKLLSSWESSSGTNGSSSSSVSADETLQKLNAVKSYLDKVSGGLNSIFYDPRYQASMDKYKSSIAAARTTVDTMINNIQSAELAISTASTGVNAVATPARPEDIAAAKAQMNSALGALQIAQAAYDGRIIKAPGEGIVTAVHVTVGEIANANPMLMTSAIELSGSNFSKDVAVLVPRGAISQRNGKSYVLVRADAAESTADSAGASSDDSASGAAVEEREVAVGASDNQNVEIISGIQAGDRVALIN